MIKQLNINILTAIIPLLFFQFPGMAQEDFRDFTKIKKILFQQEQDRMTANPGTIQKMLSGSGHHG